MAHLIDKDAVVAEIERARNQEVQWMDRQGYTEYHQGLRDGYANIISFLDTLEVKDMDLENDFGSYWGAYIDSGGDINNYKVAKYFFELGVKVQKEE